jgi:hypothetical protein
VAADRPYARPPRHRYFDTAHAILQATVDEDLPDLDRAVFAWPIPCQAKTRPATPVVGEPDTRAGQAGDGTRTSPPAP